MTPNEPLSERPGAHAAPEPARVFAASAQCSEFPRGNASQRTDAGIASFQAGDLRGHEIAGAGGTWHLERWLTQAYQAGIRVFEHESTWVDLGQATTHLTPNLQCGGRERPDGVANVEHLRRGRVVAHQSSPSLAAAERAGRESGDLVAHPRTGEREHHGDHQQAR